MSKNKEMINTIEDIIDSCKTSDKIHAALDIIFSRINIDLLTKEVSDNDIQENRKKPISIIKFWQSEIKDNYYWLITLNKNIEGRYCISFTDVQNFRDVNTDFYEEKC